MADMTVRRTALLALALLSAGVRPALAQSDSTRACTRRVCVHVDAFLGAGLAGVRIDHLVEQAVWMAGNPPRRDTTQSWYSRTTEWDWRPAVSSGILIGIWPEDGIGIGAGAHIVWVPDDLGDTKPFPGVTLHVGSLGLQAYGGWVWTPNSPVVLPGYAEHAYLPPGLTREQFLVRGGRGGVQGTFLFGIVIGKTGVDGAHR